MTVWSRVHHKVIVSETGNATTKDPIATKSQFVRSSTVRLSIQLTQRPVQLCRPKLCLQPGPFGDEVAAAKHPTGAVSLVHLTRSRTSRWRNGRGHSVAQDEPRKALVAGLQVDQTIEIDPWLSERLRLVRAQVLNGMGNSITLEYTRPWTGSIRAWSGGCRLEGFPWCWLWSTLR